MITREEALQQTGARILLQVDTNDPRYGVLQGPDPKDQECALVQFDGEDHLSHPLLETLTFIST